MRLYMCTGGQGNISLCFIMNRICYVIEIPNNRKGQGKYLYTSISIVAL